MTGICLQWSKWLGPLLYSAAWKLELWFFPLLCSYNEIFYITVFFRKRAPNMRVNMWMIWKKAKENIPMVMVISITASGRPENDMEKESILTKKLAESKIDFMVWFHISIYTYEYRFISHICIQKWYFHFSGNSAISTLFQIWKC